jgi:hypothetical protein
MPQNTITTHKFSQESETKFPLRMEVIRLLDKSKSFETANVLKSPPFGIVVSLLLLKSLFKKKQKEIDEFGSLV